MARKLVPLEKIIEDLQRAGINPSHLLADPDDICQINPDDICEIKPDEIPELEEDQEEGN